MLSLGTKFIFNIDWKKLHSLPLKWAKIVFIAWCLEFLYFNLKYQCFTFIIFKLYFQVKRWDRFQTAINRYFSTNIFGDVILVWLISILVSGLLFSTFYLLDVHEPALFSVRLLTRPKEPQWQWAILFFFNF